MTAHTTIRCQGTRLAKLNLMLLPRRQSDMDRDGYVPIGHKLKVPEPSEDWWKGWNFQLCNHLYRMDQLLCILSRYGLWTNFSSRSHTYTSCDAEGCTRDCRFHSLAGSVPASACETEVVTLDLSSSFCLTLCYPLGLKHILCLIFFNFFRWSSPHLFVDLSGEIQGPNPGWIFRAPGFSWANVSRMRPGKSPKWTSVDIMHKNHRMNWWIFQRRLITKYY